MFVKALYVSIICSSVSKQDVKSSQEKHSHYSDGQSDLSIRILIGVGNYYSLISRKVVRDGCGPIASESCLSWALASCSDNSSGISSHCFETHFMGCHVE